MATPPTCWWTAGVSRYRKDASWGPRRSMGHRGYTRRRGDPVEPMSSGTGLVPPLDHRLLALVAEDAEGRGVQGEASTAIRGEVQPSRREHPEDVAVGEQGHVPFDGPHPLDDAIGPFAELLDRLATDHAVPPQVPARPILADA